MVILYHLRHFHDMFVTRSLCFHFRFEGGGCEECSLLAEALSIALQVGEVSIIKRPNFSSCAGVNLYSHFGKPPRFKHALLQKEELCRAKAL